MNRKQVDQKINAIVVMLVVLFAILVGRLSYLQLVETDRYRILARDNLVRIVPVIAPRGEMYDRNGIKVVGNRPTYTVSVSDLSLKGTTYHVMLNRWDPVQNGTLVEDLVDLIYRDEAALYLLWPEARADLTLEELARVLRGDRSPLSRLEQDRQKKYTQQNLKKILGELLWERLDESRSALESGRSVEIAVVYSPTTVARLKGGYFIEQGISVTQKKDALADLIAILINKGVGEGKSQYEWESEVRRAAEENRTYRPFEPVKVAEEIPYEVMVFLREERVNLPGIIIDVCPIRDYPYGSVLAHVVGYVRNIDREQYLENKDKGYLMTDLYGQAGLESVYEYYLKGTHGARQVEVDARNRLVRDLGIKPPVAGNNLELTVDLRVQVAAEKALQEAITKARRAGNEKAGGGAAVVVDVNSGAVLAMASYPTFYPGVFASGLSGEDWKAMQESGAEINRVIAGLYPPGSTFKMVVAASLLKNEVVSPDYFIQDPGYYRLGAKYFRDWKPGGHGRVNLIRAIKVSCNTYFWEFGRRLGVNKIASMARAFGLGEKTGIELPGEAAGVVPTPEYKYEKVKAYLMNRPEFAAIREKYDELIRDAASERERRELERERDKKINELLASYSWELEWQTYDTLNMSIGQGYILCTPIQLATYVAAVANGGKIYQPYVVDKIVSPDGRVIKKARPQVIKKVDVSPADLAVIRKGMHEVTLPPDGTAAWVFDGFTPTAAAKTGTAEVEGGKHALMVAFAPYEKPEVAVAVVVEYGGSGSTMAGPVVRQILDAYFHPEQIDLDEYSEHQRDLKKTDSF